MKKKTGQKYAQSCNNFSTQVTNSTNENLPYMIPKTKQKSNK